MPREKTAVVANHLRLVRDEKMVVAGVMVKVMPGVLLALKLLSPL